MLLLAIERPAWVDLLTAKGWRVEVVPTSPEAIEQFIPGTFDLVMICTGVAQTALELLPNLRATGARVWVQLDSMNTAVTAHLLEDGAEQVLPAGLNHAILVERMNSTITTGSAQDNDMLLTLMDAWQTLENQPDYEHVADTLHNMVLQIPRVGKALVWLQASPTTHYDEDLITATDVTLYHRFEQLYRTSDLDSVFDQLQQTLQPIVLDDPTALPNYGDIFFADMNASHLVLVPIVDSARISGLLIAGVTASSAGVSQADISMLEHLTRGAGRALERLTFVYLMNQRERQLDIILRSIAEGCFFINQQAQVAYCNPQLTELTGIHRERIIDAPSSALFNALAVLDVDPAAALAQFETILRTPTTSFDEDYPIVVLNDGSSVLHIEMVPVERLYNEDSQGTWAGIVREVQAGGSQGNGTTKEEWQHVGSQISLPQIQAMATVHTLIERYRDLDTGTLGRLLRDLEQQIDQVRRVWNDLSALRQLNNDQVVIKRNPTNPIDLVESIFDDRYMFNLRRDFDIQTSPDLMMVDVDAEHIVQALTQIMQGIQREVPPGTRTRLFMENSSDQSAVRITIDNPLYYMASSAYQQIFATNLTIERVENGAEALGMYLARQIILLHGGTMQATNVPSQATRIVISLPAADQRVTGIRPGLIVTEPEPTDNAPPAPTVVNGDLSHIYTLAGRSNLTHEVVKVLRDAMYNLDVFTDSREMLTAVEQTPPDLIVMDADLSGIDSVRMTSLIRQRTNVPLVIISDVLDRSQKIALMDNAIDAYLSAPMDRPEILAEIQSVARRARPAERIQKPIEIDELRIDLNRREVFVADNVVPLTRIEYELLRMLAINKGVVVKRETLLSEIWGPEFRNEKDILWVNISRLRKKLGSTADGQTYIQTRPRVGYMLKSND
ncbi:MAG: winged helix-turn-helix domain-containing protein [Chloroflexota bacterium]